MLPAARMTEIVLVFSLMMLQVLSFMFLLLSSGARIALMVLLVSSVSGLEPGCLRLFLLIVLEELLSFAQREKLLSLLVLICSLFFSLSACMFFFLFLSFAFLT